MHSAYLTYANTRDYMVDVSGIDYRFVAPYSLLLTPTGGPRMTPQPPAYMVGWIN